MFWLLKVQQCQQISCCSNWVSAVISSMLHNSKVNFSNRLQVLRVCWVHVCMYMSMDCSCLIQINFYSILFKGTVQPNCAESSEKSQTTNQPTVCWK